MFDVGQRTFEKIREQTMAPEELRSGDGLLHKIAVGYARDSLRATEVREDLMDRTVVLDAVEGHDPGFEHHQELLDAVMDLPERLRVVTRMKWLDRCKVKQIAEELGVGVRCVQKRLKRALELLREYLPEDLVRQPRNYDEEPEAAKGSAPERSFEAGDFEPIVRTLELSSREKVDRPKLAEQWKSAGLN